MSRPSSPSAANRAFGQAVGGSRTAPTVARWTAIAIAVAAILDPPMPLPSRARPPLRLIGAPGDLRHAAFADGYGAQADVMANVTRQLRDAGFALDEPQNEAATVFVGNAPGPEHPPSHAESDRASARQAAPVWVLDTTPAAPNVRVIQATSPAVRLPGQAVDVRVALDARGVAGKTSEIVLEDAGILVASVRHQWTRDHERWQASLQYWPPGVTGGLLRVKAVEIPGETSTDDNSAEIAVPPMRGPIRTLVVEAGVTWPAVFVRRAIEGEPAFAVAAVQRASARIATRAGAPPAALTRGTLAPFEVAVVGAPGNLTPADVEALRWFVEERGGIAVLIPDQPPSGLYREQGGGYVVLLGTPSLESRALETAVPLGRGLMASEVLIARRLPPGARMLAGTEAGEAVVFSARRGAGAVIFSGALDAWRYRAASAPPASPEGATAAKAAFADFWRRVIVEEAATVPPAVEVSVDPPVVAIGAPARVRARVRATELPSGLSVASSRSSASAKATADKPTSDPRSPIPDPRPPTVDVGPVAARAVSPGAHVDVALRLWPTAEPGVFEGEWRPSVPGDYDIAVSAGPHRGDLAVTVAAAHAPAADPEGLALVARASGGRVFRADQSAALVDALKTAFPTRTVTKTMNPMRSPWWVVPFTFLLCAEWALRRRRGLP